MRKQFDLDERTWNGEMTVQMVLTTGRTGQRIFEKQAFDRSAASPAYDYLQTVTPEDGVSILLVNAMGAYETYDENRNGDGFPNYPFRKGVKVKCGDPNCQKGYWIGPDEVLSKHYQTFEKGHLFKHHKNNDPEKSIGGVRKAFWNERMQRVELVVNSIHSKDPELAKRIADREYPAVSMGAKVPWDVCTICGHRAPTRREYCEHARNKMRQILKTGEKVAVLNPSPRFFDISIVFRPADPTGFVMKKVAEDVSLWIGHSAKVGEEREEAAIKFATVKKVSDIRKQIAGLIVGHKDEAVEKYKKQSRSNAKTRAKVDSKTLEKLSRHSISDVLSAVTQENCALSSGEVAGLFLKKAGFHSVPGWLTDRIVAMQPQIDSYFQAYPDVFEKAAAMIDFRELPLTHSARIDVRSWLDKSAGLSDYARSQAYSPWDSLPDLPIGPGAAYRAYAPPRTDVLTMTDPNTGHVYQTTRGAAQAAHHADMKTQLAGTALLSAAYYHGLNRLAGGRLPWWAKAAPAAALGWKTTSIGRDFLNPNRNPHYLTDQGMQLPGNTEFKKLSAVSILDKASSDYVDCVGDVENPHAELIHKIASHDPSSAIVSYLRSDAAPREDFLFTLGSILLS